MPISAPNLIQENSAATPGLWNSIVTQLWQNDLSLSGGTVGLSSNTLTPESGNTISSAATDLRVNYVFADAPMATPTAIAATQLRGFVSTVYGAVIMGFGTTADVTLMNRAGTPVVAISPNSTILLLNNMEAFYATTGLSPTVVSTTGRNGVFFGTVASVRINGTLTAPTAATNGGLLGAYAVGGYDGTTVTATGGYLAAATENWAVGAHGTRLILRVIATGALTTKDALVAQANGDVTLSNNLTVAGGTSALNIVTYSSDVTSTTAFSTPSALSATQSTMFANGTSGATLMGYGTAGDATLKNRAGNDVLIVLANTLDVELKGTLTVASNITQTAGTAALQAITCTTLGATSNVLAGAATLLGWSGRTYMSSSASGVIELLDSASTAFSRLNFGVNTSSFPALKRSSATLQCRLGDDSDYATFHAKTYSVNGTAGASGTGTVITAITVEAGIVTAITVS